MMEKLLSCAFNMGTGRVELRYSDGSMIYSLYLCRGWAYEQPLPAAWLIYNDPLSYAELILNGDPKEYLQTVTEPLPFDFDG